VHQRYIQTERGLEKMQAKWARGVFGHCPRVLCNMMRALPYGEAVDLGYFEVKVFCPLCQGLYNPDYQPHGKLDGALFGPSFAPLFLVTYPLSIKDKVSYVPTLYGFKVNEESPLLALKQLISHHSSS